VTAPSTPATLEQASGPEAGPAPAQAQPSARSDLIGAIVSSLLLAAWIGWRMGWVWALAGVFGVLIHELGHLALINALGCGPGRIHFIPFLGGAATMRRAPDTVFKGVLIALAGPTIGLLATLPFFALYQATGQGFWLGGAFFIAVINMVNLAPAPPLDGSKALGPALARIHPVLERVALLLVGIAGVLWALGRGDYIFALFIGLGSLSSFRSGPLRSAAEPLSPPLWAASVLLYAAALALCLATLVAATPGTSMVEPLSALRRWGF
jgi:Zn-dependent protease